MSKKLARNLRASARLNFRRNLQRLMADNNLINAELARQVGRNRSQVKKWLDGTHEPDFDVKDAIAVALGVSVDVLFKADISA